MKEKKLPNEKLFNIIATIVGVAWFLDLFTI